MGPSHRSDVPRKENADATSPLLPDLEPVAGSLPQDIQLGSDFTLTVAPGVPMGDDAVSDIVTQVQGRTGLTAGNLYLVTEVDSLFDLGLAAFADAGKMWAGNVPYGADSDWKA